MPLAGLKMLTLQPLADSRGSLNRMFCAERLKSVWPGKIIQINHTKTVTRGSVRGLHFQHPPHAERKLVTCLRGEVWDVVVDLRADSPTFLRWHAEQLSESNHQAMLIPEGFAHGFQSRTPDVELLYLHSAAYEPKAEGGISALDPRLAIPWPEAITQLSERDRSHPRLDKHFAGLVV